MTDAPVFFIIPTGRSARRLRRFSRHESPCASGYGYHNADVELDFVAVGDGRDVSRDPTDLERKLYGPRWPTKCAHCDYEFAEDDEWQIFCRKEYVGPDGALYTDLLKLPVGACYDATWFHQYKKYCGPDGRSLHVATPDGVWCIDARASNCTMPNDDVHKCWVRHGKPEDGTLHVDKNGFTCQAGAGSIQMPKWHGFLHNGRLSENG